MLEDNSLFEQLLDYATSGFAADTDKLLLLAINGGASAVARDKANETVDISNAVGLHKAVLHIGIGDSDRLETGRQVKQLHQPVDVVAKFAYGMQADQLEGHPLIPCGAICKIVGCELNPTVVDAHCNIHPEGNARGFADVGETYMVDDGDGVDARGGGLEYGLMERSRDVDVVACEVFEQAAIGELGKFFADG